MINNRGRNPVILLTDYLFFVLVPDFYQYPGNPLRKKGYDLPI